MAVARGNLSSMWFHEQGSNPGPPYWERSVLATGPPEKSPYGLFLNGPGMPCDVFGSGLVSTDLSQIRPRVSSTSSFPSLSPGPSPLVQNIWVSIRGA